MKLKATFLGGDGWGKGVLGVAGSEASEGTILLTTGIRMKIQKQSRDFVQRYHAKYGDGPIASSAALAYDSFNIIMEAIRQSGSLVRSDIRDAMAQIKNYQGVTGSFTMDFQGDPLNKSAAILTYKDGSINFVKLIEPLISIIISLYERFTEKTDNKKTHFSLSRDFLGFQHKLFSLLKIIVTDSRFSP